jgi:2-phospho-L-lactate guanylyltransferase
VIVRVALIPVKELARAKERLRSVLADDGRRALVLAMLGDVLESALSSGAFDAVSVVSRDDSVLSLAKQAGAVAIEEPAHGGGLNAGLELARGRFPNAGELVVLPADLPLALPQEIQQLAAAAATSPALALVASGDGGTNALALSPAGLVPFRFGPDSARRHENEARQLGVRPSRLSLPSLLLDIDTPADLSLLVSLRERCGPRTAAALGVLRPATTGSLKVR